MVRPAFKVSASTDDASRLMFVTPSGCKEETSAVASSNTLTDNYQAASVDFRFQQKSLSTSLPQGLLLCGGVGYGHLRELRSRQSQPCAYTEIGLPSKECVCTR